MSFYGYYVCLNRCVLHVSSSHYRRVFLLRSHSCFLLSVQIQSLLVTDDWVSDPSVLCVVRFITAYRWFSRETTLTANCWMFSQTIPPAPWGVHSCDTTHARVHVSAVGHLRLCWEFHRLLKGDQHITMLVGGAGVFYSSVFWWVAKEEAVLYRGL